MERSGRGELSQSDTIDAMFSRRQVRGWIMCRQGLICFDRALQGVDVFVNIGGTACRSNGECYKRFGLGGQPASSGAKRCDNGRDCRTFRMHRNTRLLLIG